MNSFELSIYAINGDLDKFKLYIKSPLHSLIQPLNFACSMGHHNIVKYIKEINPNLLNELEDNLCLHLCTFKMPN